MLQLASVMSRRSTRDQSGEENNKLMASLSDFSPSKQQWIYVHIALILAFIHSRGFSSMLAREYSWHDHAQPMP